MKKTNEILQRLGISQLNDMQEEALAAIVRSNDDVVILSPTGTGKTLAYLLPLVGLRSALHGCLWRSSCYG